MPAKKKHLKRAPIRRFKPTNEQLIYIENNFPSETDEEIAEHLGINIDRFKDYRFSRGLFRKHETSKEILKFVANKVQSITSQKSIKEMKPEEIIKVEEQMTEDEKTADVEMGILEDVLDTLEKENPKKTFELINKTVDVQSLPISKKKILFQQSFSSSNYGKAILSSLTADEKRIFFEQLLSFLDYTDDLTPPEMQTLTLMCLEVIRQTRILKEESRLAKSGDSSVILQKEYNESVSRLNKYQQSLKITRDQRLKNASDGGVDIVKLLHAFRDERTHKKAVNEAALYSYITDVYENGAVQQEIFKKG